MPVVYPALYQHYFDHPTIKVTLQNSGGAPSEAGRVLFFAKGVMDAPTETDIPAIEPFSSITVPIRMALAPQCADVCGGNPDVGGHQR